MNQRKPLKELNLLDKFLFDEAMDDPENVKTMLDIILSQNNVKVNGFRRCIAEFARLKQVRRQR